MGEVLSIGPRIGKRLEGNEGYSDNRHLKGVEWEIKQNKGDITGQGLLAELYQRFPTDDPLTVLDGGCGYGGVIGGIGELDSPREVYKVGITREAVHKLGVDNVDLMIIGSVERAHERGIIQDDSVHLILDIRGAAFYDRQDPTGSKIVPIYSSLLRSKGLLLIWLMEQNPEDGWMMLGGREYALGRQKESTDMLSKNGLSVMTRAGEYTLLEKT